MLGGSYALYTDAGNTVLRLEHEHLAEAKTGLDMAVEAAGLIINALQKSGKTVVIVAPAPSAGQRQQRVCGAPAQSKDAVQCSGGLRDQPERL